MRLTSTRCSLRLRGVRTLKIAREEQKRTSRGSAGPVALLLVAIFGVPMVSSAQIVDLLPDSGLLVTLADPTGPGSDTQPLDIEPPFYPDMLRAMVRTTTHPTYGVVVSEFSFVDPEVMFTSEGTFWEVEYPYSPPPPDTVTVLLLPSGWNGSLPPGSIDVAGFAANTTFLDLSAFDLTVDEGGMFYDSLFGTGFAPIDPNAPLVFEMGPTGTVALTPDGSQEGSYEIVITIPLSGSAELTNLPVVATFAGDMVLVGYFQIPVLPIPPFVGLGVALGLLVSGALSARRFSRDGGPR